MGTDGIRFCPDWFWLQFQENVRAKIVPNILFFFPPLDFNYSLLEGWTYYEIFSQMTNEYVKGKSVMSENGEWKKKLHFLILLNFIFIFIILN